MASIEACVFARVLAASVALSRRSTFYSFFLKVTKRIVYLKSIVPLKFKISRFPGKVAMNLPGQAACQFVNW